MTKVIKFFLSIIILFCAPILIIGLLSGLQFDYTKWSEGSQSWYWVIVIFAGIYLIQEYED
jgi:hypothetical protein